MTGVAEHTTERTRERDDVTVDVTEAEVAALDARSVTARGVAILRSYVRETKLTFAVAMTGAVMFSAGVVATTAVLGWVTDEVIVPAFDEGDRAEAGVGSAVVLLVGLAVVRAVSLVLRRYWAGLTTFGTQRRLRRRVADTYVDVPISFHRGRPTGELLAHADSDVLVATEVLNPTPFTTGVMALIVFSLVSLALVDVVLLGVALALFPALAVVNRIYTSKVEGPATRVQEAVAEVFRIAHESFEGALVVKVLGRAQAEEDRLAQAADELCAARIHVGRLRAAFEPAIDGIPNVAIIALLALGSWRVSEGQLDEGGLVQAMALFGVLAFPMRVVGFFLEELPKSVVASERIQRVLRTPRATEVRGAGAVLPDTALRVDVDDVGFAYDDGTEVLAHTSFTLRPGEIVALVGSTGAGKTTLCDLLVGLVEPTAGRILLAGNDLRDVDRATLRSVVGMVFQESFLFADSVRENLSLGADVDDEELHRVLDAVRADRFVRRLPHGLDTVLGERGVSLSGGQRQRIALARTLLRRPRVLLLDDATSAVDPRIEAEILSELRRVLDTTTLVVAHRLSTIEFADRVLYLSGGRVAGEGTHRELLADPGYAAIVQAYEEQPDEVDDEPPEPAFSSGAAAEGER
jgi:ATP-binding cassette, subfamily B, bacterial